MIRTQARAVLLLAFLALVVMRTLAPRPASSASRPLPWAVDDGWRILEDDVPPAEDLRKDGIWRPGEPITLFGLPGETLAIQIALGGSTAQELELTVSPAASTPTVAVEAFVVLGLAVMRRSAGKRPSESLGWAAGARPWLPGKVVADPLVPIARARVAIALDEPHVVWLDLTLPEGMPQGIHHYEIRVADATMPLRIEVGPEALPYRAVKTMVYFDPERIRARVGSEAAVRSTFMMLHRHQLSAITPIEGPGDVAAQREALTGALFSLEHGYHGPGERIGTDVVVIGAYGALGAPTAEKLATVEAILTELAAIGIKDAPGVLDVFLYAIDERCTSSRAGDWRLALRRSRSPRLRTLRVGQTCSDPPDRQAADIVMMPATHYQPGSPQNVWIYNGTLPKTGAFLSDSWPISLRANAWIQARFAIARWFYWESAFWHDDNPGGHGPYDPFATAETFHNDAGDHCNGDGVLLYPGRQPGPWRDLQIDGVIPSVRLKQWRRGLQDAGYLSLARKIDPVAAEAILGRLVGDAFLAKLEPSWPLDPGPWLKARRELFDLIRRRR